MGLGGDRCAAGVRAGHDPDGVRVSLGEWRDPAEPEILLIHGQAQSHLSFAHQIGGEACALLEKAVGKLG